MIKKKNYISPKEAAKKLLTMTAPAVVTPSAIHKGKTWDYLVTYPDGSKEGIDIKNKLDKAKIDLQLSLDKIKTTSSSSKGITIGQTSQAMEAIKKWRDQIS